MSRPDYDVEDIYTGAGNLAEYDFNFKIFEKADLEVVVYNASGVMQNRVRGTDTSVLISSVTFDSDDGGGTVTLLANLASGYKLHLLLAEDEPTQPSRFRNARAFVLRDFENLLDRIVGGIQRAAYLFTKSLRYQDNLSSSFDNMMPDPVASTLLGYETDGLSIRNYTLAELALLSAGIDSLGDISDVTITSVADEDVLQYDSGSGNWVNAQVATSASYAAEAVASGGDISSVTNRIRQYRPVSGSGGAQSASTTPFGTTGGWQNGTEIILRGTSDTNTLTITHNDAAKGAILNGNAVLGKNDILTLIYDSTDDRWIEVSRNF